MVLIVVPSRYLPYNLNALISDLLLLLDRKTLEEFLRDTSDCSFNHKVSFTLIIHGNFLDDDFSGGACHLNSSPNWFRERCDGDPYAAYISAFLVGECKVLNVVFNSSFKGE